MNARERVKNELQELTEKIDKLNIFIKSINFNKLSQMQRDLLKTQRHAMCTYRRILKLRLDFWENIEE